MESITAQLLELVDAEVLELLRDPGDRTMSAAGPGGTGAASLLPPRPSVEQALRSAVPGDVVAAQHRGRPVAVAVLADGRAYAVADRCPHDGGLLSDGFVDGDRLVCARHGWEIDPCNRRCVQRPRELIDARAVRRR